MSSCLRRALLWVLPLLVLPPLVRTAAEEDALPVGRALRLDGRLDEAAWTEARLLPAQALSSDGASQPPEVRVLAAEGRLWIGMRVAESPGPGMGFSALLAPESTVSAADAVAVAYAPQDPRGPRFVARGPRGVGRGVYRLEAAAHLEGRSHWSVEASIPFADLDLAPGGDVGTLRLALAVRSRRPQEIAWAPPTSAFQAPDDWARLIVLPASRDTTAAELPDGAALVAADERDAERLEGWRLYLAASRRSAEMMVQARGFQNLLDPTLTSQALRDAVALPLLDPLERMAAARPDLAFVHVLRGDVERLLGDDAAALAAYAEAEALVPGLPEASFGAWIQTRAPAFASGRAGAATNYAAARAGIAALSPPPGDPLAADGVRFAGALVDLAEGEERLTAAADALETLAARYGFDQLVARSAKRAREAVQAWGVERQRHRLEAERDDLPRVRLRTTRGEILLELFEDDAPNTVAHFLHLARAGTYTGATVGATMPFLAALLALDRDPGYAIPTEKHPGGQPRPALRGRIGLLGGAPDSEAAAFFLTTGTATHLRDDYVVFGRVLEGQEVVDALQQGDAIQGLDVVRIRDGSPPRPVTAKGELAPDPR